MTYAQTSKLNPETVQSVDLSIDESSDWYSFAACKNEVDTFFLSPDDQDWEAHAEKQSKAICQTCPVIAVCLADELTSAVNRKRAGTPAWLTLGVVGGATRFEREQMIVGGQRLADELRSIAVDSTHAEAQEIRKAFEMTGPDRDEIADLTDTDIAARYGASPKTARRWREEKGISKPQGMPAWKELVNATIMEALSDQQPHERVEIKNIAETVIPNEELEKVAEKRAERLKRPISNKLAASYMANHFLYGLGEKRRGLLKVWEDDNGKQWVAAIGHDSAEAA